MPYRSRKTGSHKLEKLITIKTQSLEEMREVKEKIYDQLVGNTNYINSAIILNSSDDRHDWTTNEVHIYFFDDCVNPIPEIKL